MNTPQLIKIPTLGAPSGGFISICDLPKEIPFPVKRIFWIYDTPEHVTRGNHAHYTTVQILIAIRGAIRVHLISPKGAESSYILDSPATGLLIPANYWHSMEYSGDAVQLVLTSTEYDQSDYIRDFEAYKKHWDIQTSEL